MPRRHFPQACAMQVDYPQMVPSLHVRSGPLSRSYRRCKFVLSSRLANEVRRRLRKITVNSCDSLFRSKTGDLHANSDY